MRSRPPVLAVPLLLGPRVLAFVQRRLLPARARITRRDRGVGPAGRDGDRAAAAAAPLAARRWSRSAALAALDRLDRAVADVGAARRAGGRGRPAAAALPGRAGRRDRAPARRRRGAAAEPLLLARRSPARPRYGLSERLLPGVVHLARVLSAGDRLAQPLTYWNGTGAFAALGLVLAAGLAGDPDAARALRRPPRPPRRCSGWPVPDVLARRARRRAGRARGAARAAPDLGAAAGRGDRRRGGRGARGARRPLALPAVATSRADRRPGRGDARAARRAGAAAALLGAGGDAAPRAPRVRPLALGGARRSLLVGTVVAVAAASSAAARDAPERDARPAGLGAEQPLRVLGGRAATRSPTIR